jgi:two-component system cell cycle response regulator
MSPESRATSFSAGRRRAAGPGRAAVSLLRAAGPAGKPGSKLRRAAEISQTTPGLDLATRLRVFQRALRSHVERRGALLDIVRAVNTTLEPEKVADLIVQRASTWVPAPCWALVAADESAQLSVLADRGLEPDMGPAVYSIANWVIERGEEFVSADLRRDARVAEKSLACVIAFPLSSRGRRVGALIGLDRVPSAREPRLAAMILRAVRVLLEPAAVALDNALQLKRAEALSVTDDLTRLYNTRYMNNVLRRETKRASRSGRPLSLLFLDLDGFKSINDTYGHLFGSRALVEAAAVIRGSARETDVVARFGGDEFALILPDTGSEGAFAVGERIRERIAAHRFLTGDGLSIRLTCSVGLATLPDAAASAEELMQAADKAMYIVKDRGKNGIQVAAVTADT